jgi:hypothetical protein
MMMISRVPSPMYMASVYPCHASATHGRAPQTGAAQWSATVAPGGSSGSPAASHASSPPASEYAS